MQLPDPYFKNVPVIGDLTLDYIIFEDECPILFVCKTAKNQLYLCDCCDTYQEQKWLIAPVTVSKLQQMLEDKITIREVFENAEDKCCVATWSRGDICEKYTILSAKHFLKEDLPEKGAYIEGEEGEYKEYLEFLRSQQVYFSRPQNGNNWLIHEDFEDAGGSPYWGQLLINDFPASVVAA